MSHYIVSARKYRPGTFDTVIGQPVVTNTLKNAVKTGKIAHAYLFCGSRGVGKTTCARIFAKTINCFNPTPENEACGECESCKSFSDSRSVNIHELDAASNNTIDDIRSLIDKVRILPQLGKFNVYIVDEVHMLSQSAFNAFLKTLEEPPAHAVFILATTEKHKILPTILSRCQIFDFNRIRVEDIVDYLAFVAKKEDIRYEEDALNVIALKAEGAMRDALSIFDQVASFSDRHITYKEVIENLNVLDFDYYFRCTDICNKGETSKSLLLFNEIIQKGFDGLNFIQGIASHFRDLLVCKDPSTLPLLEVSEVMKQKYSQQAQECSAHFLFSALEICNQCEMSVRSARNQRLHIELALMKMCAISEEKKNDSDQPILAGVPESELQNNKAVHLIVEEKSVPPSTKVSSSNGEMDNIYHGPNISIKDALQSIKQPVDMDSSDIPDDKEETDNVVTDNQPVSMDLLLKSWDNFAEKLRNEKPRMAITLKNINPVVIKDHKITVGFENSDQMEDFNRNVKSSLEHFLCTELKSRSLAIEPHIIISADSNKNKLYTSEEKFKYLSEKNPAVDTLRQKFNLELE